MELAIMNTLARVLQNEITEQNQRLEIHRNYGETPPSHLFVNFFLINLNKHHWSVFIQVK
jgi:hypothetical protein